MIIFPASSAFSNTGTTTLTSVGVDAVTAPSLTPAYVLMPATTTVAPLCDNIVTLLNTGVVNDGIPYAIKSPTLRYARKSLILDPVTFPFALIDNSVPVGNTNFSFYNAKFAAKVDTPTVLPTDFTSEIS